MAVSWGDAADYFVRSLPGIGIIAAVLVARTQLKAARRATALTIAKSHYREFLYTCIRNADVAHMGATPEALATLKMNPEQYQRFRWLVTQGLFALQEIYFAYPDDKHWRRTVVVLASAFRAFILSDVEIPMRQREGWNAEFMAYLLRELKGFQHPITDTGNVLTGLAKSEVRVDPLSTVRHV